MLSCCFKETLRSELTSSDLHFSPFPKTHSLMSRAWRAASVCCKANKSYQGKVKISLISKENKAKETALVVNDLWLNTRVKYSCKAIKEMTVYPKACLNGTHELIMMFVFIQFCFHIICQRRMWYKSYEEKLLILFPESYKTLRHFLALKLMTTINIYTRSVHYGVILILNIL